MVRTTVMTPRSRSEALEAMSDDAGLDVLVIGGGVTGAGIALDAVTRGLRVGVVEAQDWASGTSSRTTRLVHGGLRYLQMLDFHLVHEALTERDRLLTRLAPHLVRPVAFLYPLEHRIWERAYVGAGVALYDTLATASGRRRAMPLHRHLSRRGLERRFPDLRHRAAVGAVQYWDAWVDDARLVLTIVRTAVGYGALAASRTQVVDLTRSETGRVTGAVVVDLESGEHRTITARRVIAATGVWTEETEALSGTTGGLRVLASKGIHLVVPRDRIEGTTGLIHKTERSVLFIIPWPRYWVIGTTDTPWTQELVHPVATAADVDYVLEHVNAVLARPLTRDDVVATWAGLRPLLQPGTKAGTSSAKVSREHTVASPAPGLTVIAGGKLTTYRAMARDAVDFALGPGQAAELPSITEEVPLAGAVGLEVARRQARTWARAHGWPRQRLDHLLHRYGSLLADVVTLVEAQPDLALPLAQAPAYLRVEVAYAAAAEGVVHLEDVLVHRTRLACELPDRGVAAAPEVAALLADVLGWDEERTTAEVAAYTARARAEVAAEHEPDDASAAAVRMMATDLAPMLAEPGEP